MFVATVNVPGYMPMDDEPPTFETAREAWQYLVTEVERQWDEYPEDENGACVEAHTAMHVQDQSRPGSVYTDTPGYEGDWDLGLVYSVTEVPERILSDEETADYLAGHGYFPGALETDHGIIVPTDD